MQRAYSALTFRLLAQNWLPILYFESDLEKSHFYDFLVAIAISNNTFEDMRVLSIGCILNRDSVSNSSPMIGEKLPSLVCSDSILGD